MIMAGFLEFFNNYFRGYVLTINMVSDILCMKVLALF